MSREGRAGVHLVGTSSSSTGRESSRAHKQKDVATRSVVDEMKKRVMHITGVDRKSERENERNKEEKMVKARAAAWAWYQHGKGGKECISNTSGGLVGTVSTPSVRAGGPFGEPGHKSSRFKTEALKASDPPVSVLGEPDRRWHHHRYPFQIPNPHSSRSASSLFDSYELDSVSKRIDFAFHGEISPASPQRMHPAPRDLPVSLRPSRAYTTKLVAAPGSKVTTAMPTVNKSRSFRIQFPGSVCRSISDVVSREEMAEMALGIDIGKCDCHKFRVGRSGSSGWSLRKISKALHTIMHLPECDYHPQQQHHERRQARLRHIEYDPQRDYDYHHHLHYQVKLRDGIHHVRRAFGRSVDWWCFI